MGRNIFRQSAITAIILITLGLQLPAAAVRGGLPQNRHIVSTTPYNSATSLPRDDHRKIPEWSVPVGSHPLTDRYIRYFSQGEGLEYVNRCLDRARPFRNFIASRLQGKGMPPELIYLPLIESAYRSNAVSVSGASGLWQFMMNSIVPYDITVDAWRDDRRDFWRATEGALDKLEYNYSKTGDWFLALAAYNCGLNKVLRTVKETGINDYWELSDKKLLPRETRSYIPKLIAVAYLCEAKGISGIPLGWENSVTWVRIPLEKSVDIRRLARQSNVPEELLLLAHGELNYSVTPPPRGSYYLKVPEEYKEQVESALQENKELLAFKRYKIQSGDTLSEIAEWYEIPVSYIKEYNPDVESRFLRIGQVLLVPVINESIPDKPGLLTDNLENNWSGKYTVQPGDSLWKIAMRHETSPEEIAAGNGLLLETKIVPGMQLVVPGPGE